MLSAIRTGPRATGVSRILHRPVNRHPTTESRHVRLAAIAPTGCPGIVKNSQPPREDPAWRIAECSAAPALASASGVRINQFPREPARHGPHVATLLWPANPSGDRRPNARLRRQRRALLSCERLRAALKTTEISLGRDPQQEISSSPRPATLASKTSSSASRTTCARAGSASCSWLTYSPPSCDVSPSSSMNR